MLENRIQPLDSLRGIAIIAVIVFHLSAFFGPQAGVLKLIISQGFIGVQLFFIVSAITMCENWDRRSSEANPTPKFYIRRVARIAGPFWLAIILYRIWDGLGPSFWAPDGISTRQILTTALFVHTFWPDSFNSVVPGGWSIGVEMLFYLFFPFLAKLKGTPKIYLCIGFALYLINLAIIRPLYESALANFGHEQLTAAFLYDQFFNQAPIFLIGIATYRVLKGDKLDTPASAILAIWMSTSLVLKYALHQNGSPYFWLPVFAAAAVTYAVLKLSISLKPIAALGEISYSTYLSHFAVIFLVKHIYERSGFDLNSYSGFLGGLVIVITITWPIGIALRYFVEMPSSGFGRAIIRSLYPRAELSISQSPMTSRSTSEGVVNSAQASRPRSG